MALVTLRSYRDPIDAELDKAGLDAAGIPSVVLDASLVGVNWLYSNALGGVKLKVDEADLDLAREIVDQTDISALTDVRESQLPPGDGDICPSCGSSNVNRSRLLRSAAALSLALGFPLIAWRKRWICSDCGHSWKPVALEAPSDLPEETVEAERSVHERAVYPGSRILIVALIGLAVLGYLEQSIHRRPSTEWAVSSNVRECTQLPESQAYLDRLHQRIIDAWNVPYGTAAHDITLTLIIESDGSLGELTVLRGPGDPYDQTAVDAVRDAQPFGALPNASSCLAGNKLHLNFRFGPGD
jgi:hypothetical protein